MSPSNLQLARDERDHVRMVFTLNNGKKIFPPDTAVVISSTSDSMYLVLDARDFKQSAKTSYASADLETAIYLTVYNSSNGSPIIWYSLSYYRSYPSPDPNIIFSSFATQYFCYNFPHVLGQLISDWTRDPANGLPTQFFYETGRTIYVADQGTKF